MVFAVVFFLLFIYVCRKVINITAGFEGYGKAFFLIMLLLYQHKHLKVLNSGSEVIE